MSMKKKPITDGVSGLAEAPIFYADQMAGLSAGPHVCKITFGVDEPDNSDYPRAVLTLALPTIALLGMLEDLNEVLGGDDFRTKSAVTLLKVAQKMSPTWPPPTPTKKAAIGPK